MTNAEYTNIIRRLIPEAERNAAQRVVAYCLNGGSEYELREGYTRGAQWSAFTKFFHEEMRSLRAQEGLFAL